MAEPPSAAAADLLARTRLQPVPSVPEVHLHLARDLTQLWQQAEEDLGRPLPEPPFWAAAWSGGQAVARYLLDHPGVVAGRSVLDLASGSGLCAIAAARAGAARVLACDVDELAVAAIAVNAAANGVAVEPLHADLLAGGPAQVDVVLAGDVCYEQRFAARALAWLRTCADQGVDVLLGDPGRAFLPREGLRELARYEVRTDAGTEDAAVRTAAVHALS